MRWKRGLRRVRNIRVGIRERSEFKLVERKKIAHGVSLGKLRDPRSPGTGRKTAPPPSSAPYGALWHTPYPHGSRHGLFFFALRAGKSFLRAYYARIRESDFGYELREFRANSPHRTFQAPAPSSPCGGRIVIA